MEMVINDSTELYTHCLKAAFQIKDKVNTSEHKVQLSHLYPRGRALQS